MSKVEKIKNDLEEIVKLVNKEFGANYATKNPGLVQHLMDKIQQEEDRQITKTINSIS